MDRRLYHFNTTKVERKRYFEPISMTAALAGLTAAAGTAGVGYGIFDMFNKKKKDRNVPDPLAGLRLQLQELGRKREVWGEEAKKRTMEDFNLRSLEGKQGINENIRAERGFGNTSLQDELNRKLDVSLGSEKANALLNIDKYVNDANTQDILNMSKMYPSETELPEEENWQANLLGMGANLAVNNWMQDQQWKRMADIFGKGTTTGGQGSIQSGFYDALQEPASSFGVKPTRYLKFK